MNFIVRIIVTAAVAFGLSYILRSGIQIDSFWTALLLALVLAILNAIIKPILIILTFPITIITLGLFLFVINALMILLTSHLVEGFKVNGFWWALLFSLLLSTISSLLYKENKPESKDSGRH
jgi:putative membrane protein